MSDPRRLLLVEDDLANRITLAALLEDLDHEVEVAASLAEATVRLARAPHFALVLLDRRLGDGDGLTLIPAIRSAMPEAKILVLSGEPGDAAGADGTFCKGDGFERLVEQMERLFLLD